MSTDSPVPGARSIMGHRVRLKIWTSWLQLWLWYDFLLKISRKYLPAQANSDCEDTEVKNVRSRQVSQGVRCFWFYLLKDSDNDKENQVFQESLLNDIKIVRRIPMCMEWFFSNYIWVKQSCLGHRWFHRSHHPWAWTTGSSPGMSWYNSFVASLIK